jgi:hypothetical protein
MAISYRTDVGPFAQGDQLVTFVELLEEATSPIVLYRPASATTDLGLYGSSHVGLLGGIIKRTNVECILQLDLLKTDYYHGKAYPTFLYYNPHATAKTVEVEVGPEATDVYDAKTNQFLARDVRGRAEVTIPADAAIVAVLAPAGAFRSTANDLLKFVEANLETQPTDISKALALAQERHYKEMAGGIGLAWGRRKKKIIPPHRRPIRDIIALGRELWREFRGDSCAFGLDESQIFAIRVEIKTRVQLRYRHSTVLIRSINDQIRIGVENNIGSAPLC